MLDKARVVDRGIIRGIIRYSHLRSNWSFDHIKPLYQTYPFSRKQTNSILIKLNKLNADGLIGYLPADLKLLNNLVKRRFPAVAVPLNELIDIDGVVNIRQGTQVGIIGAEHLLVRGFKHFAFIGADDRWSKVRLAGFKQRIEQAGFSVSAFPVVYNSKKGESEQRHLATWLRQLHLPVGVMASNDDRCIDIVKACRVAGLNIPDQVAILGVDNDEMICNLSNPPLSSIRLNAEQVGYQAAEALDHLLAGDGPPDIDITLEPTGIVTRLSTDVLAINDQQVVQVIRFIRSNARRDIRVSDVVNQSCLSIRALQQRFRRAIGCSINREIHRVRIQQLADHLINTNLTIDQIAYDLAFRDSSHISRIFRKEIGVTPMEYRRRFGRHR